MTTYDYIIVGGGSAGCVMAARLSERSGNKVLLCEAGPDIAPEAIPAEISDAYPGACYADPRYHWTGLKASTDHRSHNAPVDPNASGYRKYIQARVLGGGSSINGQMANRGAPADFDEWEERGAKGWGWPEVLPYFRKLERDLNVEDDYHGQDGPIAIRRLPREHWTDHAKAVGRAFERLGYSYSPDQNGKFDDAYFSNCMSNEDEKRCTAATAYLTREVRNRANLTIWTDTSVERLMMEGTACTGVQMMRNGKREILRAAEVVLCSGAIYSPAHLLRAGIGPAVDLQALGIQVVANRPGVGARLMDHPSVALGSFIRRHARMNEHSRRHMQMGLRYTSPEGDGPADMYLGVISKTAWHAVGEQMGAMAVMVSKTYSEAGKVHLASADPSQDPLVNFNLLSDSRDMDRLKGGFRLAHQVLSQPDLKGYITESFPASYSERVIQFGAVTPRNRNLMKVVSLLLDGPAVLRKYIINTQVIGDYTLSDVLEDDAKLEEFVRNSAIGAWHPCCTNRMGRADDPMAVTDAQGRVHGVSGLRVIDSSIFPVIPRGNINLPTMMVAEKISAEMV